MILREEMRRNITEINKLGTSLVVQWLRLRASTAGGTGLIPGWGTKIPHAVWPKKKKSLYLVLQNVAPVSPFFFSWSDSGRCYFFFHHTIFVQGHTFIISIFSYFLFVFVFLLKNTGPSAL